MRSPFTLFAVGVVALREVFGVCIIDQRFGDGVQSVTKILCVRIAFITEIDVQKLGWGFYCIYEESFKNRPIESQRCLLLNFSVEKRLL